MIIIKIGNIFESTCDVLVNTINCVGVMGKGIALEFKKKYPKMYMDYIDRCQHGKVNVGKPYMYISNDGDKILNFPTKDHWRSPSRLSYVIAGLDWFVSNYKELGITSIAFPPLGCGNGGLTWDIVGPIMFKKLAQLPIRIEIYAPFGTGKEQLTEKFLAASSIDEDVRGKVNSKVNYKWYLILEAIRELNDRKYSMNVGRTIYQKLCYVITRNGVHTGFSFSKGNYGPYSLEAKESITALANANLILEKQLGRMISLTIPEEVRIQRDRFTNSEWNAMKKTVDLFARIFDTEQAEIVATVLYSFDELHKSNTIVSDKNVYDYVMSWKPHWHTEKDFEVRDAILNLAMLDLMPIAYSGALESTLPF